MFVAVAIPSPATPKPSSPHHCTRRLPVCADRRRAVAHRVGPLAGLGVRVANAVTGYRDACDRFAGAAKVRLHQTIPIPRGLSDFLSLAAVARSPMGGWTHSLGTTGTADVRP